MEYVVIDDEEKGRLVLKKILGELNLGFSFLGEADSVASGIELITQLNPQVVFLDIEMEDGTGFDLLNQLPELDFQLVFITAYDHYAVKAFKYNAIDYLLKPVDKTELETTLKKISEKPSGTIEFEKIKALIKEEIFKQSVPQIAINDRNGITFIKVNDIVRCEASSNYTEIYLLNGTKYIATKTLKEFDKQLAEHNFFRIHNAHLVNVCYIKSIDKNGYVILEGNVRVEVSRRKKVDLLALIAKL